MKINLSVATSADHCIDDMNPDRLTLSTQSDWAEVYRLRAAADAILIGGETLRRDNPTLGLKGEAALRADREPMRVIVSGEGEIDPSLKIFHKGRGEIVIFSNIPRPELQGLARVVVEPRIDVAVIVTRLEKLGVKSLFVEGGAKILNMFLESGMATSLRLAVNPTITIADSCAPRFELSRWIEPQEVVREKFEQMEVSTLKFATQKSEASDTDRDFMRRTIEYSRQSPPKESCYRVGATLVTTKGEIFEGYTLETSHTHHAEQAAMTKALNVGAELCGATIYASMEPCSQRSSERESCSELILKYGIRRVVFALYEPSHFVECRGAENLRRAGVEVLYLDEFARDVRAINSHILA